MQHSESLGKIAPAIVKAQAEFNKVAKSKENKFDKYNYANLEDYLNVARPILAAHSLSVITSAPTVVPVVGGRQTNTGKPENACHVQITLTLLHESGEFITVDAWGEGQDRADKSVYKAMTGARKYGVAMLLGLVTSDDPEADEMVGGIEKPSQQRKTSTRPSRNLNDLA